MGLNFRKSLSIGKLFRINFSKRGVGVSAGVKGARVSLNKDGIRETFSLPGTGLSWSERQSFRKKTAAQGATAAGQAAGGKAGKKVNIGSLVWVALVAGAFLLYRSGALDPALAKIQSIFTGAGTQISASASPTANSISPTVPEATAETQSTSDASVVNGVVTVTLKDGKVNLSDDTKYVASKSGSKFHKPSCRTVSSIAVKNLLEYETRDDAVAKKEPCSVCNP